MSDTTTSRSIKSDTTSSSASSQVVQDVLTTNYSPIASNEPQAATSEPQAKTDQDDYESDAWDEASGSEIEYDDSGVSFVGTTHQECAPWFKVEDCDVLSNDALVDALDAFQQDCELDAPLKFRPFIAEAVEKLRKTLDERVSAEWLLKDIPGSEGSQTLCEVNHEVLFPVKRPRLRGSRSSDSCEF
jgi:hypothetical protein